MAERSSGAGTDTTTESAGADASSAGVQISVGISNQEQSRNSPGFRISSTGQRTIINCRTGATSLRPEISLLSTGMRMEPGITLGWLSDVMEGRFIPSKVTEAMLLGVDRIELGVGPYTAMLFRNTRSIKWPKTAGFDHLFKE